MTIFNKDFYPSTPAVIHKLCRCLPAAHSHGDDNVKNKVIFDPAAGDARILKYIKNKYADWECPKLYACEIEPELVKVIEAEGFPVMAGDFLSYQPRLQIDYIITNPPFSFAAKFLIHAWDIMTSGAISMILPKTILKRNDSFEFQAMRLVEDYGTRFGDLMYEDLGKPFAKGAQRTTDAECILVTLVKKANADGERLEFDVENDYADMQYEHEFATPEMGVMPANFLGRKLAIYRALLEHFAEYRKAHKKMISFLGEFDHYPDSDKEDTILKAAESNMIDKEAFNAFYDRLTEAAWNGVIDHPDFQRAMTTSAKQMIDNFRKSRNRVDFNEANIKSMFMALVAKSDELLRQCIFDAFDTLTEFHWKNRVHVEGWKSNKAHMVNTRCVLPYVVDSGFGSGMHMNYRTADQLNDIDKGLCMLMGIPVSQLDAHQCPSCKCEEFIVYGSNDDEDGGNDLSCRCVCKKCHFEFPLIRGIVSAMKLEMQRSSGPAMCYSHFFKIRYYGKGTAHLYFRDLEVWQRLNVTASKMKGWLPDGEFDHRRIRIKKKKPTAEDLASAAKYKGYNPCYSGDRDERFDDSVIVEIAPKLTAGNSDASRSAQSNDTLPLFADSSSDLKEVGFTSSH